ncbi:MAG: GNAT family N-acetyltransferase [Clostridia bacterium]
MVVYKLSSQTDKNFIDEVVGLDSKVYKKEFQGTKDSITERFNKNEESYILAYNGNILVGYVCFFPISKSLSEKLRKENKFHDDDITSSDIERYVKGKEIQLLLISAVVAPEFSGNGIGKALMQKMFDFLEDKIQAGYIISTIFGEAVSLGGYKLLTSFAFERLKTIEEKIELLIYQFDTHKETNVFAFVPCSVETSFCEKNYSASSAFIDQLQKTSQEEFSANISNQLNRLYLFSKQIAVHKDTSLETAFYVDCNFYMVRYKNLSSVILEINNIGKDPAMLLDEISTNTIMIRGKNNGANDAFEAEDINLTQYLKQIGLTQNGETKTLISLVKKPTLRYLSYLLAGEEYVLSSVENAKIISKELTECASTNIAQYDFSEIYCSEKNIAYIIDSNKIGKEQRAKYQYLMLYIIELLCLQVNVISQSNNKIVEYLDTATYDLKAIEQINLNFSQAIKLWSLEKYNYLLARKLAQKVSAKFGIENLKKEFKENLAFYETISNAKAQRETSTSSATTKKYFTAYSVLSGFSTLSTVVGLFFALNSDNDRVKSIVTLVIGFISISVFVLLTVFSKKYLNKSKKQNDTKK